MPEKSPTVASGARFGSDDSRLPFKKSVRFASLIVSSIDTHSIDGNGAFAH